MARKKKLFPNDTPLLSDSKVILELIQYNEKEYAKYEDLPIAELIANIKADQVNWINLDGLEEKSIVQ